MSTATETPAQHGLAAHSHGAGAEPDTSARSALDRFASFDVDAHPVPRGREEEWRFTPMSRLLGLHDDAPLDGSDYSVAVDADPRVAARSVSADESRRGTSTYVPVDRPSARAWASAEKVFAVDIPRDTEIEQPAVIKLTGASAERGAAGWSRRACRLFRRQGLGVSLARYAQKRSRHRRRTDGPVLACQALLSGFLSLLLAGFGLHLLVPLTRFH
jgi:hypothetical protein